MTRQKENVTQKTEKHGNDVKSWNLKSRKQLEFQEKKHRNGRKTHLDLRPIIYHLIFTIHPAFTGRNFYSCWKNRGQHGTEKLSSVLSLISENISSKFSGSRITKSY